MANLQKILRKIFSKKILISFAGTDMHHDNHLNALKSLASKKSFYKLFENIELKNKELL